MNISTMIVLMILSMLTNTPGLSAIPLIQMILSKSGSNIESMIDKNGCLRLGRRYRVYLCMSILVRAITHMTLSAMHV